MGASDPQIEPAIAATGDLTVAPSDDARSVVGFGRLPASTTAVVHSATHWLLTEAVG